MADSQEVDVANRGGALPEFAARLRKTADDIGGFGAMINMDFKFDAKYCPGSSFLLRAAKAASPQGHA
jgi:hypothetical protein